MEKNPLRRVMLVDDNHELREGQAELLNRTEGYICVADCGNAEDAMHSLRTAKPDVVIMDIYLDRESRDPKGIELTAQVKAVCPHCLVIMQTISDENDNILKSIRAGADGYIQKGAPNTKLIDVIDKAFDGDSPLSPGLASRILQLFRENIPPSSTSKRMLKGMVIPENLHLTPTQERILNMMVEGKSRKEIAAALHMKEDALKWHIKEIYREIREYGDGGKG
jgi:DNA-binding NarL/FixJ family response regulator